jgi:PhzF family phenazine biosynthesis protein
VKAPVLHFDVFTSTPGKGNPAGIVLLPHNLEAEAMQTIAASTGFGDTAFMVPSKRAQYGIRYFSPRKEVDLCGHATIAASIALAESGLLGNNPEIEITLETRAGLLPITIVSGSEGRPLVLMSQGLAKFQAFYGDRGLLLHALNISEEDLDRTLPIVYGFTGRWTLVLPVRSLDGVRRMKPQTSAFPKALTDMPDASIHPFCLECIGDGVHMHARHFSAPTSGTIEDPVTGTASGVLAAYYRKFIAQRRPVPQPILIEQGYEVGREGQVLVWTEEVDSEYAVRIGGTGIRAGPLLL